MKRYDTSGKASIDLREFTKAFSPLDKHYAHMLQQRSSNGVKVLFRRDDVFHPDTIQTFKNMWLTHLKVELKVEEMRAHLAKNKCFLVNEAFNSLDVNNRGRIGGFEI